MTYDGAGHRQVQADATGTYTWSYDNVYRVTSASFPDGSSLVFTWDSTGHRKTMTDTLGRVTTYTHDAAGRIETLENGHNEVTTFVYDDAGRRLSTYLQNGTRATFAYDKASRVLVLANQKSDGSTIGRFTYSYDDSGNRLTVAESTGARVTYTYDDTYQLLREQRSGANGFTHTFTYDAVGNRLSWDDGSDTTNYTYNEANELLTASNTSGTTTYSYDPDGNQRIIESPSNDLTTHTWDFENRLTQVELPSGDIVTHIYNADHQRVANIDVAGVKTTHIWDANNVITDLDDTGSAVAEYTLEPVEHGNLLSERRDSNSSVYHYDAQHSTRAMSDDSEVVTDEKTYSAYGPVIAETGTTETPYEFNGELQYRRDSDTGQHLLLYRWYRDLIGRFLSSDPEGFEAGDPNLQRYVGNNPATLSDPSGLAAPHGQIPQRSASATQSAKNRYSISRIEELVKQQMANYFKGTDNNYAVVIDATGSAVQALVLERTVVATKGGRSEYYELVMSHHVLDLGIAQDQGINIEKFINDQRTIRMSDRYVDIYLGKKETERLQWWAAASEFALHAVPFGAAIDHAMQGKYGEATLSLAGDVAFFLTGGASLGARLGGATAKTGSRLLGQWAAKEVALGAKAARFALVLEGGVGTARAVQGIYAMRHEQTGDAVGYFGEAFLSLVLK